MFKHTLLAAAAAASALAALPAHALGSGDIAFTSFNADEDGWSLVAFADLAPDTVIFFTDNEWNGNAIGAGGAFNSGESYTRWTTGAATIRAGSVVRFSSVDTTSLAASSGTLAREPVSGSSNFGLSQSGDTIYAYVGGTAETPTAFLTAISSAGFSAAEGALTNTQLVAGTSALKLSDSSDYADYTGARSGQTTFAGYRSSVFDIANWSDHGDGSFAATVPDTTAFTLAAVPEPGTYGLLLAGLAGIGFVARRRRPG